MASTSRLRFAALSLAALCAPGCASGISLPAGRSAAAFVSQGILAGPTGPIARHAAAVQKPDGGRSWMAKNAKSIKALLYVSDHHTNDVYVYNFKTGAQAGKLTGFHDPYGQCVDTAGNVWIANYSSSTVVEYAHGATKPLTTLSTNGHSIGCAVDYANDLYVANITTPNGAGDLQVWTNESGTATNYSNGQDCYYLWPPGAAADGQVILETNDPYYSCELLNTLRGDDTTFGNFTIAFPGATMWDGQNLTLTDQEYNGDRLTAIDRVNYIPSGGLDLAGRTVLNDTCNGYDVDVMQPFIVGSVNPPVNTQQGTIVVGGNLSCKGRFDFWKYPVGGEPIKTLKNAPLEPYGASVSLLP